LQGHSDVTATTPALRRVIGPGALALIGINAIVGAGIFGLPSIVAAGLGAGAVLAYAFCAVLIGLVALCFAEAGSRVGGAGGLYAYVTVPFGSVVGGVAGTLLWLATFAASSAAVVNLLVDTVAVAAPAFGGSLPRALLIVGLYGALAAVNVRGVRHGVRLNAVLALIKLAPLVLLAVAGLFKVRTANLHWTGVPTLPALSHGAVVVFFAFIGLETALCTSGELKDPARTVPRAIAAALILVTALYVALQLTAQGVLGTDLPRTDAPLIAVARTLWGPWGAGFMIAATVLSIAGYLTADVLCSPRVLYALAERGQLPGRLCIVHQRYQTPAAAIAGYAIICATLAVSGSFRQLVLVASSGTLLVYLLCCLGVLRLRARQVVTGTEPFQAPGGPFVPLAASAMIVATLLSLQWKELIAAFGLVLAAGIAYALQEWAHRRRGPENLAAAAAKGGSSLIDPNSG
jgi:basic amino acid/polyamine antiporter, APA family